MAQTTREEQLERQSDAFKALVVKGILDPQTSHHDGAQSTVTRGELALVVSRALASLAGPARGK